MRKTTVEYFDVEDEYRKTVFKDRTVLFSSGKIEIVYRKKKVSHPCNALHLQALLRERAKKAFKPRVYKYINDNGVINKCAAYCMRLGGNPQFALTLLRRAGQIAHFKEKTTISIKDLDLAESVSSYKDLGRLSKYATKLSKKDYKAVRHIILEELSTYLDSIKCYEMRRILKKNIENFKFDTFICSYLKGRLEGWGS